MIDALLTAMAEERGKYEVLTSAGIGVRLTAWKPDDVVPDNLAEQRAHLERLVLTAALCRIGAVVVPREPTGEMIEVGLPAYNGAKAQTAEEHITFIYRAMIAAGEMPAIAALRQVDDGHG